jgi:hypothetical protein
MGVRGGALAGAGGQGHSQHDRQKALHDQECTQASPRGQSVRRAQPEVRTAASP